MGEFLRTLDWPGAVVIISFIFAIAHIITGFFESQFWNGCNVQNRIIARLERLEQIINAKR